MRENETFLDVWEPLTFSYHTEARKDVGVKATAILLSRGTWYYNQLNIQPCLYKASFNSGLLNYMIK